jgi:hypothetical protein
VLLFWTPRHLPLCSNMRLRNPGSGDANHITRRWLRDESRVPRCRPTAAGRSYPRSHRLPSCFRDKHACTAPGIVT